MANEVNIKIKADDLASGKISNINQKAKDLRGTFALVAGAGAAVGGALALFTNAALQQQTGINELRAALEKLNIEYEKEEDLLEKTFAATQAKTNFGDDQQRDALTTLLRLTGDYNAALTLLPAAFDIAATTGRNLERISLNLARAYDGEVTALDAYIVSVEEGATASDIAAEVFEKYGGAAEAARDPIVALKNATGDLQEAIGDQLLPALQGTLASLEENVNQVIAFANENPKLTQTIVLGAGAFAALAVSLGVIGIALPAIIGGFTLLAPLLAIIALGAGAFHVISEEVKLLTSKLEVFGIETIDLKQKVSDFAESLKNDLIQSFQETTQAIDDNTTAIKDNADEAIAAAAVKIDKSDEVKQALMDDMTEIAAFETRERKKRGAEIRAAAKAAKAAEEGRFNMTFADFLAIENARVMGLPDVIDVGNRNMSNDLANAFRNFAAGSQVSEHGERGRAAQTALKGMMNTAGYFDNQAMPSIHGATASVPVQVIVNGDIYGQDDFDLKVSDSVINAVANGNNFDIFVD